MTLGGQVLECAVNPDLRLERGTTDYEDAQRALARFNRHRLTPGLGEENGPEPALHSQRVVIFEDSFMRMARNSVAPLVANVPDRPDAFVRWFESLADWGPGQGDSLFPWLAARASYRQMCWFLEQEVAGEAGFGDLVAMTQVKMPVRAKLEMARNYWDEMGRGDEKGMHGPMLERLVRHLGLDPRIETTVAESLALGNIMVALAANRRYAFHSVGALGVIEMTAPRRAVYVVEALDRLEVPKKESHYFSLHAVLDVKHSRAWNAEIF